MLSHLIELRTRLIHYLMVLVVVFLTCFYFSESLYSFAAKPLINQLPKGGALIATQVTATFMVPTKLAFMLAIFLTLPYLLYQLWRFIAPGLYRHETQPVVPYLCASLSLFYLGAAFAFTILCPLALHFFTHSAPTHVVVMTDIGHYLDFILHMLIAAGLAFQVPIVTLIAIDLGWFSIAQLKQQRPYVIIGAFTLGMFLTPPDVVSQILLSIPMWGLFEAGLLLAAKRHPSHCRTVT